MATCAAVARVTVDEPALPVAAGLVARGATAAGATAAIITTGLAGTVRRAARAVMAGLACRTGAAIAAAPVRAALLALTLRRATALTLAG